MSLAGENPGEDGVEYAQEPAGGDNREICLFRDSDACGVSGEVNQRPPDRYGRDEDGDRHE